MRVLSLLALAMSLSLASANAAEMVVVDDGHGHDFKAFVAGPDGSKVGVVIVHDWFGLTDLTKESVERLGRKGARAIAVDLYDGQNAQDHDQAKLLSSALEPDHAQAGIMAALTALNAGQKPVAVVGYSMGGRIALRAAAGNPDLVKAVALIYGGGFDGIDDRKLSAAGPILAVTGSADTWSYSEQGGLEQRVRSLGGHMETYVYPGADHAFAQRLYNDGKNYDPVATEAMRNVLDDFLERHLGTDLADQ